MNFDSDIKSPISEATDIVLNMKCNHAFTNQNQDKLMKWKNQFFVVLKERLIQGKTLRQVAAMLNIKSAERIRQIEAKLLRILRNKMKGYK